MFCPECGAKNEEESRFCFSCGARLEDNSVRIPQQPFRNQQPYPQQPEGPVYSSWPPAGEKVKKPVSKFVFVIAAEVIAAVLLIFGSLKILGDKFSPESVVMDYWEAAAECDWGTAYDYCEFPDDSLTKQMYVNANAGNTEGLEYKSVKVADVGSSVSDAVSQIADLFGVSSDSTDTANDSDIRYYAVEYLTKGSSTAEYTYLTVTKTGNKVLLFWDEWKVVPSDSWCSGLTFEIPENAVMTLNGADMGGTVEAGEDGYSRITIPYLFAGEYQLEVSEEGMETYRKKITVTSYGCSDTYIRLVPSEDTVQAVAGGIGADIQAVMEAALAGKDFSAVQDMFAQNAQGDVKERYETLASELTGENSDIVTLHISNITASLSGNPDSVYMEFYVTYDVQETYILSWSSSIRELDTEYSEYVTYVKDGDEWKLSVLPVKAGGY